eukprot:356111-Chlamydomonas_euryale.AAC.6
MRSCDGALSGRAFGGALLATESAPARPFHRQLGEPARPGCSFARIAHPAASLPQRHLNAASPAARRRA